MLTIFIPSEEQKRHLESLEKELHNNFPDFVGSFKIVPPVFFNIRRQSNVLGTGSKIFYLKNHRQEDVTFGALFLDFRKEKYYVMTTSHLNDTRGKEFYFENSEGVNEVLGKCVAYACQSDPLLEACLVELDERVAKKFAYHPTQRHIPAFRNPRWGTLHAMASDRSLREVVKCGMETVIVRGWIKLFSHSFYDLVTNDMIFGVIVTLPVNKHRKLSDSGDSGGFLSTASCQAYSTVDHTKSLHTVVHFDGENTRIELQNPNVPQAPGLPDLDVTHAHEAVAVHCFGASMTHEGDDVGVAMSFCVDLAIQTLQAQIRAELVFVPILDAASFH